MTKFPLDRPRCNVLRCTVSFVAKISTKLSRRKNNIHICTNELKCTACGNHIFIHEFPPLTAVAEDYPRLCMRIHIQDSTVLRLEVRLHEGAIRIPFKQVAARMKLISLRLLCTRYIPEVPPIPPFGKLREINEFSAGKVIKAEGSFG